MFKKIVFIALLLVLLTGVFNTVITFPVLQKEFVEKPFFSAFYNNIGTVIFGPTILIIGAVMVAIYLWIKFGKRDKNP